MRYFFEDYSFDTDRRELQHGSNVIPTTPQVFDLLAYLILNRERVVSKDDLINVICNGRVVSDAALTTRLNAARSVIGDSGEEQRLIKTLPRKGFRFVGTVQEGPPATSAAIVLDTSMEWLKPFMTERKYRRGDRLFRKGDAAAEMFLTVTGKFLVKEIGVELPPGRLMGELGFLTPNNRRTGTVECIEDGQVLTIAYERLLEIYFQNPQFGYYFLVLTSQRLLENISRLEGAIAQQKAGSQTTPSSDIA